MIDDTNVPNTVAELDFAFRHDLEREATEFGRWFGATAEILTLAGPGGGWPIVRFTVLDEAELPKLLAAYHGESIDDT